MFKGEMFTANLNGYYTLMKYRRYFISVAFPRKKRIIEIEKLLNIHKKKGSVYLNKSMNEKEIYEEKYFNKHFSYLRKVD